MPEENLAQGWVSQRGQIVELPSGNRARVVRTRSMMAGVKSGAIPNPLRNVLSKMLETGSNMKPKDAANPEIIQQMTEFMNQSICEAVVSPKVVIPPEGENWDTWYSDADDTISIADLSDDDRVFIYGVAQGGTTDLENFRKQQAEFVASMADGEKVPVPSQRASRASKRSARSVVPG